MTLKPPTDAVARYVEAIARTSNPAALTGTQIKAGTASSSRPKRLASRPDCALCGKPVEDFTEEEGFLDRFVVFIARCHGETQRVRVELETIKDGRVDFGLAFVPENRLAAAPAPRQLQPIGAVAIGVSATCDKELHRDPCGVAEAVTVCATCGKSYARCARHGGEAGAKRSLHSHRALYHPRETP